jgi:hypothetical protein
MLNVHPLNVAIRFGGKLAAADNNIVAWPESYFVALGAIRLI